MKATHLTIAAAALALAMGAAQAHNDGKRHAHYGDTVYYGDTLPNAIHSGGMSYDDQILADKVATALANDSKLQKPGITATVSAKNGQVSLSGFADSAEQAARAEKIARDVAGAGNFSGTLSTG
jgi:osmotically-inducible protein OsmY